MTARRRWSGTTVVLGLLCGAGALILSGCGNSPSATSSGGTTTTASASASATSTSTSVPVSSSTTSTTSGAAQNLVASASLKAALTAVYVAHNQLPADQVAGTQPGSVYYGLLPATNTYWAIASFQPTPDASTQTQVSMQDDGCCGVFTMPGGGSWTFVGSFLGSPCPDQLPADLFGLWHLSPGGDCAVTTTTTTLAS